jgi:NCS1 family nucleobase:cation symporter-1
VGILPPLLFMLLVGITFGVSTGNPNPIAAIMQVAPSPAIGTGMLVFILGAQISTNLTLNILPPTHVFQDALGVSWKQGVLITGVLSVVTFPWVLFSSQWFFTFINSYAAFLGPALDILIADYWIVQGRFNDLDALYDKSEGSRFWYVGGISPSAILALLVGAGASIPVLDLSWMLGFPVGLVSYVVLRRFEFDAYLSGRRSASVSQGAD